jgi:hypothetical protein
MSINKDVVEELLGRREEIVVFEDMLDETKWEIIRTVQISGEELSEDYIPDNLEFLFEHLTRLRHKLEELRGEQLETVGSLEYEEDEEKEEMGWVDEDGKSISANEEDAVVSRKREIRKVNQ